MADIKISGLASKGANVATTDLLVISEFVSGTTYTSKKITGAELKGSTLNAQTVTTYNLVLTDAHKTVTLTNGSAIDARIPIEQRNSFSYWYADRINPGRRWSSNGSSNFRRNGKFKRRKNETCSSIRSCNNIKSSNKYLVLIRRHNNLRK